MHRVFDRARPMRTRAIAPTDLAFRLQGTAPAHWISLISRLNTSPARTPVNASPAPSQAPTHDSGPGWVATSFPVWLFHPLLHAGLSRRTPAPGSPTPEAAAPAGDVHQQTTGARPDPHTPQVTCQTAPGYSSRSGRPIYFFLEPHISRPDPYTRSSAAALPQSPEAPAPPGTPQRSARAGPAGKTPSPPRRQTREQARARARPLTMPQSRAASSFSRPPGRRRWRGLLRSSPAGTRLPA